LRLFATGRALNIRFVTNIAKSQVPSEEGLACQLRLETIVTESEILFRGFETPLAHGYAVLAAPQPTDSSKPQEDGACGTRVGA